jgi:hypothetical protein
LFGRIFKAYEPVACLTGTHKFIQLRVHGSIVVVLRMLHKKNEPERDDRRRRVNHELVRVGPSEDRPDNSPCDDKQHGQDESPRCTTPSSNSAGYLLEH